MAKTEEWCPGCGLFLPLHEYRTAGCKKGNRHKYCRKCEQNHKRCGAERRMKTIQAARDRDRYLTERRAEQAALCK